MIIMPFSEIGRMEENHEEQVNIKDTVLSMFN